MISTSCFFVAKLYCDKAFEIISKKVLKTYWQIAKPAVLYVCNHYKTATITEKELATQHIKDLNEISELEVLMEVTIINMGYVDCFVHYNDDYIEVTVAADDLSASQAVDIINAVYTSSASFDNEVIVKYQTIESLK